MAWRVSSAMEEKLRFVFSYERDEESMSELCHSYGISRETGYVWLRRYRQLGVEGLVELNRSCRSHPNRSSAAVEQAVLALREAHMSWGPRKLKRVLERDQPGRRWPATSTIGEMVKRAGLVVARPKRRRTEPQRLLANTIAHQWWGSEVSPRTLNDAWITNGMSRYGELMYIEDESGRNALNAALPDIEASALAYDTIPLSSMSRETPFSPQFQSMTLDKGAMIFHMLRWEIGDKAFLATLKGALSQYADSSIRTADFEKVATAQSDQNLLAFFSQSIENFSPR